MQPSNMTLKEYLKKEHGIEHEKQGIIITTDMGCSSCNNKLIENVRTKKLKPKTFVVISLPYTSVPKKLEDLKNRKNVYFDFKSTIIRSNVGVFGQSFVENQNNQYEVTQITPENIDQYTKLLWD